MSCDDNQLETNFKNREINLQFIVLRDFERRKIHCFWMGTLGSEFSVGLCGYEAKKKERKDLL